MLMLMLLKPVDKFESQCSSKFAAVFAGTAAHLGQATDLSLPLILLCSTHPSPSNGMTPESDAVYTAQLDLPPVSTSCSSRQSNPMHDIAADSNQAEEQ